MSPVTRPTISSCVVSADGALARDPTMAQHHDAIRHLEGVQDVVRDHHDRHAAPPDLLDQLETAPGLLHAQSGEWLVEQDQTAAPVHEAAQLDRLTLAAREVLDRGPDRRDPGADVGERPLGLGLHRALPQEAEAEQVAVQLAPHEEVGDGVDIGAQAEVLVDRFDTQRLGVRRAREANRAPSNQIRPADGSSEPETILIRVDLPAPLSPSRPTTSPARTSRLTPSSATTGPKCLVMPSIRNSGAAASAWSMSSPMRLYEPRRRSRSPRRCPDAGANAVPHMGQAWHDPCSA